MLIVDSEARLIRAGIGLQSDCCRTFWVRVFLSICVNAILLDFYRSSFSSVRLATVIFFLFLVIDQLVFWSSIALRLRLICSSRRLNTHLVFSRILSLKGFCPTSLPIVIFMTYEGAPTTQQWYIFLDFAGDSCGCCRSA